ncbi:MAG TPA: FAD-dependent oxidoreductase, partial [Actinomycetota bacterium]|nr:FAD-dependent oxidoreductase [Actinomycetota bacterium]
MTRGTEPLWVASAPGPEHPAVEGSLEADVCVVGAGIVGVTAASELQRAGRDVVVVDAGRVLRGVTGRTTAKLTAGHGMIYSDLRSKYGGDTARAYATANTAAIEHVAETVEREGIECDLQTKDNLIYTEDPREVSKLREEVEAATGAGLSASFVTETSLPFDVAGAIRYTGQAQFHPRKYLLALLAKMPRVFERSRVMDVDDGGSVHVRLRGGEIKARKVVVATHLPTVDKGLYFARAHPTQHIALTAEPGARVEGMFLSTEQPTHSVRMAKDADGTELLLIAGEGSKAGEVSKRFDRLASWVEERFGTSTFRHRWTAQDYYSVDRRPYVGRSPFARNVYLATGFSGWGMSGGVAAGLLLADLVLGRENPAARLYDSTRIAPMASAKKFTTENSKVAATFVGDRVRSHPSAEDLAPGDGGIVKVGGRRAAAYRAEDGTLTACSPRCTHLGCLVRWNREEKTWDCPCHGSRFDTAGRVLHGPAIEDLERYE